MRRIFIAAWGRNAAEYAGRSARLYRDPKVKFGGLEVGGIRISHMSHMERRLEVGLLAARGKMIAFRVEPLKQEPAAPAEPAEDKALIVAEAIIAEIGAAPDMQALLAIVDRTLKQRQWLEQKRHELHARVAEALKAAHVRLA